jgi:hypothetical protein
MILILEIAAGIILAAIILGCWPVVVTDFKQSRKNVRERREQDKLVNPYTGAHRGMCFLFTMLLGMSTIMGGLPMIMAPVALVSGIGILPGLLMFFVPLTIIYLLALGWHLYNRHFS